ncbi:hypothetical protein [Pseudomonas indica]|uniref:hypothetical protein n=1 Tax=Pseudomonas indica TaxID=137658 RepID=UPI000BAB3931|nr:hypothetical protein [Pseudomonas indica]PAU55646.1 hypothetical protein BZL42_18785 [Pseudomonas indica]
MPRPLFPLIALLALLGGCQSYHDYLLTQGYPLAYADGFQDGCGSGKQAVEGIGRFRKDVPRYLRDPLYAEGWGDAFRQCQTEAEAAERRTYLEQRSERDEDWEEHERNAFAHALTGRR